ncbi:MAG: hypothetical protein AAGF20_01445 [Pseudomonadota bacterium]
MARSHFSQHLPKPSGLEQRLATHFVLFAALFLFYRLMIYAGTVWNGALPGNDDFLRLQQVRDLLAGQSWFDVSQSRFLTPEGGDIHWSRLPDIMIGGLILAFDLFLERPAAERLATIIYPLVLMGAGVSALLVSARRLGLHPLTQGLMLVFIALSSVRMSFSPGRIDHHGLLIVLTLVAFCALISPRRSLRSGVVSGLCIAAMLSVALESLPYLSAIILGFGISWIVRGHREAPRLVAFGAVTAGSAMLFYLLDAPGAGPQRAVCDAFGQAHLAGLMVGGGLLAGLGIFGGMLDTWQKRFIAGAIAGVATLATIVLVQPECLGDPYAGLSAEARLAWLSAVGEAKPFRDLAANDLPRVVAQYGFLLAGLIAAIALVWIARPDQRLSRVLFCLLLGVAAMATVWQVRGTRFSHLFVCLAGAGLAAEAAAAWWKHRGSTRALTFVAVTVAVFPFTWDRLGDAVNQTASAKDAPAACADPEDLERLAGEAPMRLFTPIDLGMPVLARTPHSVFAGPYHRNVGAIEAATAILMGNTVSARQRLQALGAEYVLYCPGLSETARYARLASNSFAAAMERGEVPDWLQPLDLDLEGDFTVYAITKP